MLAAQFRQELAKLPPNGQRVRRPSTDVIDLACCGVDLVHSQMECSDQVIYKQDIPHLLAVAVDGNGPTGGGRNHEMR